jgi:type I restriction enzyme S subunit
LRRNRKRAIELLDGLAQSIFLEMFGDPATNPRAHSMRTFREVSLLISDGPFGSNLKSEHYVEDCVRVIRLQNIGAGEFLDRDKAFISFGHFKGLSKHECLPGDILVGTLGAPNLRACLQPAWLEQALNKADCVQIRIDPEKCVAEYIVGLINQPSTERMARGLILGQTRARISMGRLRDLKVPIAPLSEQKKFAGAMRRLALMRTRGEKLFKATSDLFISLQHRAFSGQL